MRGLGPKSGPKSQNLKSLHFRVDERQNRIKNGRVMPIRSWGKSGVPANIGAKIGYFGHIFMDFKFVFPIISIDIKGQTKLEFNWTQIDHFSHQKPQKWPYLKITFRPSADHQKPYSSYISHKIF